MAFKQIRKSDAKTGWGLLKAVRRAILQEPARLNMKFWISKRAGKQIVGKGYYTGAMERIALSQEPACGTVACLAGWTLLLAGDPLATIDNHSRLADKAPDRAGDLLVGKNIDARTDLGTDDSGGHIFGTLFYQTNVYGAAPGTLEYAMYIASKIDSFMEKHKLALKANRLK